MKEYVRRVKATVEASWLDDGETVEPIPEEDEEGTAASANGTAQAA